MAFFFKLDTGYPRAGGVIGYHIVTMSSALRRTVTRSKHPV